MKVPETIMDSLHGTDFVVDAFKFAVGDRVFCGVKDGRANGQQCLGEGRQQGNARLHGSFDPVIKKHSHFLDFSITPEHAQFLFEVVGNRKRFVQF